MNKDIPEWESGFDQMWAEAHNGKWLSPYTIVKKFIRKTLATREKELMGRIEELKYTSSFSDGRVKGGEPVKFYNQAIDKVLALLQPVEDQKGCCLKCKGWKQIGDEKPNPCWKPDCPCHKKDHHSDLPVEE